MSCSSSLKFQYFVVLIPFCNLRNHWFIYCIILLCICISYYFQYLSWPEVILESDDVLSIDLEDPDFNSIFIGAMTKEHPRHSDIVGTSVYKKFLKEVKTFSIKCAKYLQTNINASVKKMMLLCLWHFFVCLKDTKLR